MGHIETGKTGEQLAAEHLMSGGYEILERNWHWGREELDIIARKGNFVVIVEVKTRTGNTEIDASLVVSRAKQRIQVRAANAYIRYKNLREEVRFDIITILMNAKGNHLEHIEDAFYATM